MKETNKQKDLIFTNEYNLNRYNNLDKEKKRETIERAIINFKARQEKIKQQKILSCNTPKKDIHAFTC